MSVSDADWGHEQLAEDLARTRWKAGEIAGHEVSLGSHGSSGAADVASMRPSWTTARPRIWEVKVTRSDFLSDLRTEKWRRYLPWCDRLCFATPRGLVKKDEVPKGVGLWMRNENGWYSVKASRLHYREEGRERRETTESLPFALLLHLKPSPWEVPHPDRYQRVQWLARNTKLTKSLGRKVAGKLHHREQLQKEVARARDAKEILGGVVEEDRWHLSDIDVLARKMVERHEAEGVAPVFNRACKVVREAMPLDQAFDPMSLASHVASIVRERDRLRDEVEP